MVSVRRVSHGVCFSSYRLPPFYMPGMIPGAGMQLSQQLPLLQPAQISPTAAAAQYQSLADYAAYGYPGECKST